MEQGTADIARVRARDDARAQPVDDSVRVRQIATRLGTEFGDVERDRLEHVVAQAFGSFTGAPVRDFVDVFVERMVRSELRAERMPQARTGA
jgi:hypothetical protein